MKNITFKDQAEKEQVLKGLEWTAKGAGRSLESVIEQQEMVSQDGGVADSFKCWTEDGGKILVSWRLLMILRRVSMQIGLSWTAVDQGMNRRGQKPAG